MTTTDTYQSPTQGFRGEVTRACVRTLRAVALRGVHVCPSCHLDVPLGTLVDRTRHAEDCLELRSDMADTL